MGAVGVLADDGSAGNPDARTQSTPRRRSGSASLRRPQNQPGGSTTWPLSLRHSQWAVNNSAQLARKRQDALPASVAADIVAADLDGVSALVALLVALSGLAHP